MREIVHLCSNAVLSTLYPPCINEGGFLCRQIGVTTPPYICLNYVSKYSFEIVPVIRVLLLNTGSIINARKRIANQIPLNKTMALKILRITQKFCG